MHIRWVWTNPRTRVSQTPIETEDIFIIREKIPSWSSPVGPHRHLRDNHPLIWSPGGRHRNGTARGIPFGVWLLSLGTAVLREAVWLGSLRTVPRPFLLSSPDHSSAPTDGQPRCFQVSAAMSKAAVNNLVRALWTQTSIFWVRISDWNRWVTGASHVELLKKRPN